MIGQTALARLIVTNRGDTGTGRVEARIATATPSFSIPFATCRDALPVGGSCEIDVQFIPSAAEFHSGSLRLTGIPAGTLEIPLSGTGSASPGNLSSYLVIVATESTYVGSVAVGASATRAFTLRNIGDLSAGTLDILSLRAGDTFILAPPVGAECQPGVTCSTAAPAATSALFSSLLPPAIERANLNVFSSIGGTISLSITGTGTGG